MKKLAFFLTLLLFTPNMYTPVFAAGFPAQTFQGIVACQSKIPIWIPLVNTILLIISTILLGVLVFFMFLLLFGSRFNIFGSCIRKFHKKPRKPKIPNFDKEKAGNYKINPDNFYNNIPYNNPEIKSLYNEYQNGYCNKKYDPSIGYSLDCNHKKAFPYNSNNYNRFY